MITTGQNQQGHIAIKEDISNLLLDLERNYKEDAKSHIQPSKSELDALMASYNQGLLGQAKSLAKNLTKKSPKHAMAWKILGVIYQQEETTEEAEFALKKATELAPKDAEAHYNLANFYFDLNELKLAQASYARAVKLAPNFAKAYFNLAHVLKELGLFAQAEDNYKKGIKLEDTHANVYFSLAEVIVSQHRHKEAISYYKKSIALNPLHAEVSLKLGITYLTLNRIDEAIDALLIVLEQDATNASAHNALGLAYQAHQQDKKAAEHFEQAIQLRADYIAPYKNLGLLYQKMGRVKEAEACYQKALSLDAPSAETINNLAVVLINQGRYPEAEAQCRKALEIAPELGDAWNNLGLILQARMVNQEAEAAFEQALKYQPNDVQTLVNFSVTLKILGKLSQSEACLKKAIKLDPKNPDAYVNLGMTYLDQSQVEAAITATQKALAIDAKHLDAHDNLLFALEYSDQYSDQTRLEAAREYGCMVAEGVSAYTSWNVEEKADRLRIGIVSGDLRQHPVAYFLKNALEHLDANQVELFAYSTDGRMDATTAELQPYFTSMKSLAGYSDVAAAEMIHQDGIHILLDLSGHTGGNKLPVFAWKPAPVQASWLGYWATTGVEAIDYVLADEVGVPLSHQAQFTEAIQYLPQTRMCFTPPTTDLPVAPLPALTNSYITFASFQNMAKVSDEVLTLWAQVMQAVPNSRLRWQCKVFIDHDVIAAVKTRMVACGIDPAQVSFHGKVTREEYLAAHAEVDVILDSFPFPGGTTTCEALWMGVPTLTLAGHTMIGRQGASLLSAAGLTDWIVEKREDFVRQACLMVADITALANLRNNLRAKVQVSALYDGALFAKNLTTALWKMWQEKRPVQAKTLASSSKATVVNTDHDQHFNAHHTQALVQVVSATRMSEQDFWTQSALGRSLNRHLKKDARLSTSIAFNNTRGLSTIFNESIENAEDDAVLVFIHDDVWIDEEQFADVVLAGLQQFDVIGVAGNKRRVANQPAWPFIDADFTWDSKENLSGRVGHGEHAFGQISDYGAVPASCELLDGVFLAAKKRTLVAKQVMFDDQFDFHFYDLDFCRTAKKAGLSLGTWAVNLTHQSAGAFGSELWKHHYVGYLKKWEGDLSFLNKAYEKVEVKLFELGTVDEVVEHFQAVTLLPEMEYETPVVPIYGEPCVNAAVTQSHLLKHPAVYVAPVDDYQMIGSAAFPIIHQKSIRHQYFSPDIWETSEQGLGYCRIREEKNLIGYAQLIGEVTHQSKVINLVGNGSSNYAHWLTEFLPQIVLLINAGVDISEYQILVDANSFPSMLEALYLIGVKKEQLVMIEPMSLNAFPEALWVSPVANVVFQRPNALHGAGKDMLSQPQHAIFHPLALRAVRETYLSCIESQSGTTSPDKLFIKRTSSRAANLRMMVNEQEIEALLVANGFTSIDPSRLTFMQQVALFSQAKYIVSASGAALVNMLWAPEGAHVFVLMNDTKYANYWYFSNIAACVGLHLRYVLGKALPSKQCTDLHHADFEIAADAVLNALNDVGLSDLKNPQAELDQALFEVLELAIENQNAGNIEAAKQLYHEILKVAPQHALANHHLGVIEAHQQSPKVALPRLELAVQTQPENEQFWVSYIDALAMAGESDQLLQAIELGQQFGLTAAMAASLKAEFGQVIASCTSQQTQVSLQQHQPVATICTLIPAYKPDYLEALLLSLSTQTYRQFKVIISDDNPSDEVTKTVKQLQLKGLLKGLSVELVAGPKKGGFANIYHLVRTYAQQAEFFHILMDDDLIYPTFYETHMRAHANTQAQFSISARWTANESGQPYLQSMDAATSQYFSQQFTAQSIAKALIPSCNNKLGEWSHALFRSSAAEAILNPSIANISYFGLDDIGSFMHAAQAESGIWIPESLGIFRTNPHQNTGKIENATIKCAHYGWIALALIALEKHWISETEAWSGISLIRETIRARYAKEALGQQMLTVLDAYPHYQPAFKQAFLSVWNAYLGEIRIAEILQGDLSIKLL
ncbi:MAG: tetratricopeptide repeat protein [Methylophilus sp.]